MRKYVLFTLIAMALVVLSSCGVLLPQIVSITVKNDKDISDAFITASGGTLSNNTEDIYIARSTQPLTETVNISKGKEYVFSVSWYGAGRTNLAVSQYVANGPVSAPLQLTSIQDVGSGDNITLTISSNDTTGANEYEVKKE